MWVRGCVPCVCPCVGNERIQNIPAVGTMPSTGPDPPLPWLSDAGAGIPLGMRMIKLEQQKPAEGSVRRRAPAYLTDDQAFISRSG